MLHPEIRLLPSEISRQPQTTLESELEQEHGVVDFPIQKLGEASIHAVDSEPSKVEKPKKLIEKRKKDFTDIVKRYEAHEDVKAAIRRRRVKDNVSHRSNTDTLGSYLGEIGTYELINDKDEKTALFHRLENGYKHYCSLGSIDDLDPKDEEVLVDFTAAHQEIFYTNLRLVVTYSKHVWPHRGALSPMDIIQEGNLGLIRAIATFDVYKGYSFSTYAKWWIDKYVADAIRERSRTIKISQNEHEKYLSVRKAIGREAERVGRNLSDEELLKCAQDVLEIEMTHNELSDLMYFGAGRIASMDAPINGSDSERVLGDFLTSQDSNSERSREKQTNLQQLKKIISMAELDELQRFVVGLRQRLDPDTINDPELEIQGAKLRYKHISQALLSHDVDGEFELRGPRAFKTIGEALGLSEKEVQSIGRIAMRKIKGIASQTP